MNLADTQADLAVGRHCRVWMGSVARGVKRSTCIGMAPQKILNAFLRKFDRKSS